MEGIDTKEKLEKEIQANIKANKEMDAENKYVDALLEAVGKNTEVDIPEEMVEEEVDRLILRKNTERLVNEKENELVEVFKDIDEVSLLYSKKVLDAFHKYNLNESDLFGTNGYGFNDIGRDKIESIYSNIFSKEWY